MIGHQDELLQLRTRTAVLESALRDMVDWFGYPEPSEFALAANYELACAAVERAKAALAAFAAPREDQPR